MTHRNREVVAEQIEHLTTEYGEVTVEETVLEVPADRYGEHVAAARDGYVGGGYTWTIRHPEQAGEPSETYAGGAETQERALMILPRGETAWGLPGGGVEGEESFEEAAVRETREEAGVDCEITGLWHLEHVRWESESAEDDQVSHTLHAFFDADYAGGQIAVQEGEVNGAAWFAKPPSRLMEQAEKRANEFF